MCHNYIASTNTIVNLLVFVKVIGIQVAVDYVIPDDVGVPINSLSFGMVVLVVDPTYGLCPQGGVPLKSPSCGIGMLVVDLAYGHCD